MVESWASDWTIGSGYEGVVASRAAEQARQEIEDYGSDNMSASASYQYNQSIFDGEKFPGGLTAVNELFELDYWGLRARSNELFHKNPYARGIIRRLVTNIIATGLHLESVPEESIIGVKEDSLLDWAEDVETKYYLYNSTPHVIDYRSQRNGGEIQRAVKREAYIGGDCLVVLRQSIKYKLPQVQIISGERIQTPMALMLDDNVVDGVKLDDAGRHVSFFVVDETNPLGYIEIKAYGENTGRPQAKLIYGCDKREDGVRGVPLLGIAIQALSEIDRHRDSTQRKAVLNSIAVAAVERDVNSKKKSKPLTGKGANRRDATVDVTDNASGTKRSMSFSDMVPGINFQDLEAGEKVNFLSNNGVDINFGAFEATIIMGIAWALEVPPEILLLSFNKNYSASQAAINEFKMYLDKERESFGSDYCDFLYQDWFTSMSLLSKIDSGTYLQDIGSDNRWDVARAWTMAEWSGQIKPSTDMLKAVNAHSRAIEEGLTTRARSARSLFGMKFSKIMRAREKENEMMVKANKPLADFEKEFGPGSLAAMAPVLSSVMANDYVEDVA